VSQQVCKACTPVWQGRTPARLLKACSLCTPFQSGVQRLHAFFLGVLTPFGRAAIKPQSTAINFPQCLSTAITCPQSLSATISFSQCPCYHHVSWNKGHFFAITKAKRAKKPLPSPYSREPSKKTPAAAPDTPLAVTLVNCSILILKYDKFLKKLTASMKAKIKVDISQPNLYHNPQRQLWELFLPKLINKNLIHQLPNDPLQQTSLSHGRSRLPDLKTMIAHLKAMKKKPEVDLIYEDVQTTLTLQTFLISPKEKTTVWVKQNVNFFQQNGSVIKIEQN
jgi:hypothetical protein